MIKCPIKSHDQIKFEILETTQVEVPILHLWPGTQHSKTKYVILSSNTPPPPPKKKLQISNKVDLIFNFYIFELNSAGIICSVRKNSEGAQRNCTNVEITTSSCDQ